MNKPQKFFVLLATITGVPTIILLFSGGWIESLATAVITAIMLGMVWVLADRPKP